MEKAEPVAVVPEEAGGAAQVPQTPAADISSPAGLSPIEKQAEAATLAAADMSIAGPCIDIEHYRMLIEQQPKDDTSRMLLARAYRDQEQIELALEQYGVLARGKGSVVSQVIADMESIVASRPDNLAAHELLADLYVKNGQLQTALERYRWLLQRLEQKPS